MACPNINLESWKELEASVGTQRAYYLWDKYDGKVPQEEYNKDVSVDLIPEIQELNNFVLYEDQDKLCSEGICNFTASESTRILREAGLNPFPNDMGFLLDVRVKSPIGDFFITHYVASSAINNSIYIYDMPQNEFISDEHFGQGGVNVKTAYKPRLIPLTIDSIKANYNLNSEDAAKFIRNILNRQETNLTPSFKDYIKNNIDNGSEYIKSLEDQISSEGVMLDASEEYRLKENSLEELKDKQREAKLSKPLTGKEENKVINFLRNKLKLKTREYLPTKSTSFTLGNIIKSVTGLNFDYSRESLDAALEEFKNYTESDKFLSDVWNKYNIAKRNVESIDKSLDELFSFKRLLDGFFKLAKTEGIKNALSKYDNIQQYKIRTFLPSDILTKYASDKQAVFMLEKRYSNINAITKALNMNFGKPLTEIMKDKMKLNAQFEKANTVLNYLKAVDFDASYIYESIANEAKRRYTYFEKQGDVSFQLEAVPTSAASSETVNKVKQILEKMGVSVKDLAAYARETGLDTKGVNGLADLTQKLIALAEGKEGIAITEEMVHVATAIMEQVNPKMVTEMIAKIDRFSIYKEVYNAYKDKYVLENGKPDIRKIKKEAVDKLIAEIIINQNEGKTDYPELRSEENQSLIRRWWNKILDFFRGMYKKSNIDIFEKAATEITSEEGIGTVEQAKGQGVFLQTTTDVQKSVQDKLNATENSIEKVTEEQSKVDPLLMDSEEATNFYKIKNVQGIWERIKNRVTDRVQRWYAERFAGRVFTDAEKKFNELKRTIGVDGHNDLQEIHGRYYNADGTKRAKPLDPPGKINMQSKEMYQKLENYYSEFVNTLPENTLVFSEKIIYDEKSKEAGTLDFLAIEPSGKAHILDWKFMSFAKGAEDVAWYKQGAYDIQLARYKQILKDNYGITEFGKIRAIPILLDFRPEDKNDPKSKMVLKGIAIGSVDPSKIEDLRLLPVSEASETTGDLILDNTIKDLNKALTQIGKKEVTNEEERLLKREELQLVQRAIRMARGKTDLAPLVEVVGAIKSNGDKILNDYNTIYKGKKASDVNVDNQALSEFSDEMRDYLQLSEVFKDLDKRLEDLIYKEEWRQGVTDEEQIKNLDYRKDILNKLRNQTSSIYKTNIAIEAAQKDFVDIHIGQRNLISGLTSNEKVVKGFFSRFRGASELQSKAVNLLFKLTGAAKGKAMSDALQETKSLMDIRERLKKRGGDLRRLAQTIYQKDDKGGLVNKLVHRYDKDFYEKLDALEGTREAKLKWLRENIDIEKYKKDADKVLNERIERIKNNHPDDAELQYKMIQDEQKRWNINREDFDGWDRDNYILARYPLDKWFSDDYKRIKADKDLNDLYNFVYDLNEKAADVGYISNRVAKTFLPFIRKSTAEGLAWDGTVSAISTWADNLSRRLKLNPEDVGYGKYNEITGELENTIPKYYTYDFTFKDGTHDYSEVSEDLFANLILYSQHLNKYKYLSEVEGQLKVVKDIEEIKDHLKTNKAGDIIKGETERGNEANAKLFDNFMRTLLYEQKYVLSDEDAAFNVGKLTKGVRKVINKISKPVTGKDLFTIDDNSYSSMVKTIDAANRGFQLKTLGFDFISGAVNWFGGNIQSFVQSGNYFTGRELVFNQAKLLGQKLTGTDKEEMAELINTFMPLKDDPSYQLYKEAGMSKLTRQNLSDMLMVFMRKPEHLIEKTIFLSLLDNMMVENGKIISIPEFVKAKYKDRADSASKYKESQEKIKQEIAELKKTRSISATKKMVDGKLEIPGLDLNNREELQRLTNLTRRISRNAVGGMSDGDINQMSMSIWTKSMMVFKGWIPKLTDTRFGEFRKVGDDFSMTINDKGMTEGEKYDIGRLRILGYVLNSFIAPRVGKLVNMLYMTEKGMKAYDEMYEHYKEKYEKETGETLNMSKADFIDLMKNNMRKQVQEIAVLASLFGASLALGSVAPGKDEDKATKNFHRYSQKVLDKFTSELSFFYNPANYEDLLSGGIFPAVGILTDFQKFGTHFWMETTGIDLSDPTKPYDEVVKKAHPVKYLMKAAPVTKSLVTYFSLFDSDWAKEQDITIQKDSKARR